MRQELAIMKWSVELLADAFSKVATLKLSESMWAKQPDEQSQVTPQDVKPGLKAPLPITLPELPLLGYLSFLEGFAYTEAKYWLASWSSPPIGSWLWIQFLRQSSG